MNTTIDFKTAKTIENMSRKIDGMERAVSGFFNKMSDIAERKYGDPQVYLAAIGPARDLSAILLEEAPGILPCFDETDDTFGISQGAARGGLLQPQSGAGAVGQALPDRPGRLRPLQRGRRVCLPDDGRPALHSGVSGTAQRGAYGRRQEPELHLPGLRRPQ